MWLPEGKGLIGRLELTHTLLYIKYITNRSLASAGNSTQYSVIAYMGTVSKKRVAVCITDSPCWIPETNTTL